MGDVHQSHQLRQLEANCSFICPLSLFHFQLSFVYFAICFRAHRVTVIVWNFCLCYLYILCDECFSSYFIVFLFSLYSILAVTSASTFCMSDLFVPSARLIYINYDVCNVIFYLHHEHLADESSALIVVQSSVSIKIVVSTMKERKRDSECSEREKRTVQRENRNSGWECKYLLKCRCFMWQWGK